MKNLLIRNAEMQDLESIAQVESICFPASEAATILEFEKRLQCFRTHFFILEIEKKIIGFINGMVTNSDTIQDNMYSNPQLHKENGRWQTVFGIDVLPEYRKKGYATILMNTLIQQAKKEQRKGCILTCKETLIPYYEKFGYKNQGVSQSVHGGVVWYDMKLRLNK